MLTIKVAPFFQPLPIRKGGVVSHHSARGGIVDGRIVDRLDSRSEFARAYGAQVKFTDGGACSMNDIVKYEPPQKMTASKLRAELVSRNEESHFFSRPNMRFAGDTMRNYGVRGPVDVVTYSGDTVSAWELYRRKPVKMGLRSSAYFCAATFRQVFPKV